MINGLRVEDNGIDWLKQISRSHHDAPKVPAVQNEAHERRWGVSRVLHYFQATLECYLPPGHRVYATKHDPGDLCDEHIIEGPDMPLHCPGRPIERVDILFLVDDSGITYGYWSHKQEKRWLIANGPGVIGD